MTEIKMTNNNAIKEDAMLTVIFNQNTNTTMELQDFNRDITVQDGVLQSVGFLTIKLNSDSEQILEEMALNEITALSILFEDKPIYVLTDIHASITSMTNHLENNIIITNIQLTFK